jgi:hypothetical protein
MGAMAQVRVSTPASDLWRPSDDRMSYADAAWLGAAWGVAMHAILSFFALVIPALNTVLLLFHPAERLAAGMSSRAAPFVRWLTLVMVLAAWWALVAVALTAAGRELAASTRARRG